MFRPLWIVVVAGCCLPLLFANAQEKEKPKKDEKPAAKSQEQVVKESLNALATAFNKRDAAAVAALWSKTGVHTDDDTGTITEGRDAIKELYVQTLAGEAAPKLALFVNKVRFITPEVATVDGFATVTDIEDEATNSSFTAVLVKEGNKWLLDSAHETNIPPPLKPADYLEPLAWMVGNWVDEADDVEINTTVRWSAKKSFLIRSYDVVRDGSVVHQGTQVFGWDPREEVIRTWVFGSGGGFAEGHVIIDDTRISIKLVGVTPQGQEAAGTQVITQIDDNAFMSQLVGREIDGEPQPTFDAVKVVRVAEELAAEESNEEVAATSDADTIAQPATKKKTKTPGAEKEKAAQQEGK